MSMEPTRRGAAGRRLGFAEAERLESLWRGEFGNAYVERNAALDERRAAFWRSLIEARPIRTTLEVGCGQGGNLRPISAIIEPGNVSGIDVNGEAIKRARLNAPGTNVVHSVARDLPFESGRFDLVYTVGVLIHQPDETLAEVMAEIVRCSRRYVLWIEYFAPEAVEVPYHGIPGSLFKRNYGALYAAQFPDLSVRSEGFLSPDEGFDRATWQLLEKPALENSGR
jgi:pseudaminic acid biosynthesis-associated methylase